MYHTIIYVRSVYVCMCVCPSTPPTIMNQSSWNFAGALSLPLLKTGNKIFVDRTKKNSLFLGDSQAGARWVWVLSYSFLPDRAETCRCNTFALTYYWRQKKFWSDKKNFENFFLKKKFWIFFRICRIFMELAAGHYCLPQELAWKLRP